MKYQKSLTKTDYLVNNYLKFTAFFILVLISCGTNVNGIAQTQMGSTIYGPEEDAFYGLYVDANDEVSRMIVGAPSATRNNQFPGAAYVYQWDGLSWNQLGSTLYGEEFRGNFGYKVSMSGNGERIAVGDDKGSSNGLSSGTIKVYTWTGVDWELTGQPIQGNSFSARHHIAVLNQDGSKIATSRLSGPGYIRIFEFDGNSWNLTNELFGDFSEDIASPTITWSDVETLAICGSCDGDVTTPGYVKVFNVSSSTFVQIGQTLSNGTSDRSDFFGQWMSISADGNWLAISSLQGAFIYKLESGSWVLKTEIPDALGSICLNSDGTRLILAENTGSPLPEGAVYLYERVGDIHTLSSELQTVATQTELEFSTVGISSDGGRIFMGHPQGELNAMKMGQAKSYEWPLASSTFQVVNKNKAKVYPNPFNESLNVMSKNQIVIDEVSIFNSEGHIIYSHLGGKSSNLRLPISHIIPNGNYTISIKWSDGIQEATTILRQ